MGWGWVLYQSLLALQAQKLFHYILHYIAEQIVTKKNSCKIHYNKKIGLIFKKVMNKLLNYKKL